MGLIKVPHRRVRANFFPDFPVKASAEWRSRGMVALFDAKQARELISGDRATNISSLVATGVKGRAADFSGTANQQYAHRPAYAITGAITIVVLCEIDALTNYGAVVAKQGTSTTNTPYELRLGAGATDGNINFLRASTNFQQANTGGSRMSAGFAGALIITCPAGVYDSTIGANAFVNGVKFPLSTITSGGAAAGVPTDDGTSSVWIGRRYDGVTQLDGRIYYVALFDRELSDSEVAAITSKPTRLLEATNDSIWVSAGAPAGYTLTAASASFAVTGNATALKANRKLAATQATFSLTGNDVSLKAGRKLAAATQTYALTGNAAGLTAQRKLSAAVAAYALTGIDVALTYAPLAKTLTANVGSFVLTGNATALRANHRLLVVAGSYALTAQAASLIAARRLAVQAGSYAITGNTAGLRAVRRLMADAASYTLTGFDVGLSKSNQRTLSASTASFAVTGIAATLKAGRRMLAQTGQIVLTGNALGIRRGYTLNANGATYALSGQAVGFRRALRLAASQASYALTGYDVTMTYSPSVVYARAPSGSGYRRSFENTTRPTQQNTTRNPR